MNERLHVLRERSIREEIDDMNCSQSSACELLAELDATRAERDAIAAERDLLAGLLEQSDDHFSFLPNNKTLLCISEGEWEVSGDAKIYSTAIDAIRAAMNSTTR